MSKITNPFPQFLDRTGALLDAGFVYIGAVNADPETTPIATFWDMALTIPALQPLRTASGVIVNGAAAAFVFVAETNWSLRARDASSVTVYNTPSANPDDPIAALGVAMSNLASPTGAALVGTAQGVTTQAMLSGLRRRSVTEFMSDAQITDAVSGSPTLDTWAAFNACRTWCQANNYAMYIPAITTLLSKKITTLANMSVFSDPRGKLTWTNLSDCGWVVDGISIVGPASPGFAEIALPQLVGPNSTAAYSSVAHGVYDLTTFVGIALQVKDAIWCKVSAQYFIGWATAFELKATSTPTDNHSIDLGTIDLCGIGVSINSPAGSTAPVGQSQITTRNIFAFTPFNFTGAGAGTFMVDIRSSSTVVNQSGGVNFFFTGTAHSNHSIRVGTVQNCYLPDSPAGTASTYRGRLIAGDQTVLSEAGWAFGIRLYIEASFDGTVFAAGDPISIKLNGAGSRFAMKAPTYNSQPAIALSPTQGEASYNGGNGAASVNRWVYASANCNGMVAGATKTFYLYHQRLNPTEFNPLTIGRAPGATNATDITVEGLNNNSVVKREALIQITNRTAATLTGVYNLMVGVE